MLNKIFYNYLFFISIAILEVLYINSIYIVVLTIPQLHIYNSISKNQLKII
ncbi:hypothetical protein SAMN04488072_105118 [Lentibacillus halodurans]|uniref:Uncharacterized protein n=1 Tax=Lentibacillus halodurans TaxID=237679 RepID=A0A1I0XLD0_9BACI|nr:hypothetical protein SAMN04488072_105118 [Lentibacillus halodurans]